MPDNVEQVGGNGNGAAAIAEPDLRALEQTLGEIRSLETAILLDRLRWARDHGVTFDGKRREYDILGYDYTITYKQYRDEYARGGIAGRVVDVMPDACWRGEPAFEIIEDENPEHDTEFEKAWKKLDAKHSITSKLIRVDKLSRLSTYSVLLIGAPGTLDQELPKVKTPDALLYLKPFSGGGGPGNSSERATIDTGALATVHEYEDDPKSERFGLPRTYKLRQVAGSIVNLPYVHWSRIIHVAEGLLEDDVFGQPALERVWNLLTDLRKVTGGGSEAFWLRANQGIHLDIDKDMALDSAKDTIAALKEQAEAYKHQLDRWIRTRGVKAEVLGSDVANFANPADAIITQIAGSKAIPKRILTGSEMGELASSQDRENFKDQVNGRQTQHLAPNVVRQLVDRLITYGFLPVPQKGEREYQCKWPHIQVLTEDEKSTGAQKWAGTKVAEDPVFTSAEIRDKWYGMQPLTEEQMKEIDDRKAEAVKRQQEAMGGQQPGAPAPEKSAFPRAAEAVEDEELVRVLAAAIESGATDVIEAICGVPQPRAAMTRKNVGFIDPGGKMISVSKTGGLGGYGEDHTDLARRLLKVPEEKWGQGNVIRDALDKGYIRYWIGNGEVNLNFKAGNETAARNAMEIVKDYHTPGERIYLDIEGAPEAGHFFDNVREANQTIRQAGRAKGAGGGGDQPRVPAGSSEGGQFASRA